MKRRSEGNWKLRRTVKRNNGFNGNSSLLFYCKIVMIWSSVIFVDYMSELRFEYLWPFWLLLRSVYDSYRYKGLTFSFLFICIAITSDLICLFFIPIQWIFFIASSFVWIQYVWVHSEKGVCLPTIILWVLFVWMEAKIRWKDNRNMPHLDLCRPFAAHCIGYPVVTLGFGFKSYISYRIRQRKQREIAKENEFYMQLLQKALPQEEEEEAETTTQEQIETAATTTITAINGNLPQCKIDQQSQQQQKSDQNITVNGTNKQQNAKNKNSDKENGFLQNVEESSTIPNNLLSKLGSKANNNLNYNNLHNVKNTNNSYQQNQIQNGIASSIKETNVANHKCSSPYKSKDDHNTYTNSNTCKKEYEKEKIIKDKNIEESSEPTSQKRKEKQKDNQQYHQQHQPHTNNNSTQSEKEKIICDQCQKLEQEAKRLKSELNALKTLDQESKQKIEIMKGNYNMKQKEYEEAQKQITELQSQERKSRQMFESQLNQERKLRKQADEKANIPRCSEICKVKKMQLETEINKLRRDFKLMEETKQNLEQHNRHLELELRKYDNELKSRDHNQISDMAMRSALAVMQEKNATLEKNLSAETRVKLDLFSALGEARRQLEIKESCLRSKDKQLDDLKAKTAQLLAVMNCEAVDTQLSLSSVLPLNSIAMTSSSPQTALSVVLSEQLNAVKNSQLNAG